MMNQLHWNKKKHSYTKKLTSLLFVLIFAFGVIFTNVPVKAASTTTDAEASNTASFSTDVIYQIVTDRFFDGDRSNNPSGEIFDQSNMQKYHGGDWAGITQKLNEGYFTGLGVSALWISSPVENITTIDPSNNCASYHGYWAKDFFRTNPYFGSLNDFQTMIQTAHSLGIKIVIDFAPNHTSTAEYGNMTFPEDGALYRDGSYLGGFTNDPQGLFNHESWTDFSTYEDGIYHSMYGLADLNHQNATVDDYMKDAIQMWLDLGIDGIRVDAVKHMSFGWQKNWLSSVYSHKPVFVFGEWFVGGVSADSDMNKFANDSGMSLLDFRFANAVRNALGEGTATMEDLYNVVVETGSDFEEVNDQVTFIDNHDMSRFMTLASNNSRSLENAYVVLLTSRGVPTIYYGSEQYATGTTDPYNRGDMPSFNTNSTAYKVISYLSPLRKTNPALAYGTTQERWMNDDILIYERQFGNNVVVTAVNRNQSRSTSISGLNTNLPQGTYNDVLNGTLGGGSITVSRTGAVNTFTLGAGQSAVWQYTATSSSPLIGNVDPMMGIAGDTITITGRGFGSSAGSVKFGTNAATVLSWTDSLIKVAVPSIAAGKYPIKVTSAAGTSSNTYGGFEVLSGTQISARLKVNNASTDWGSSVYVVGNVYELGNWDPANAIGPMFNSTSTIGMYPTWFYDVNLPAGQTIQYKFIKKDANGNVIWESGSNHTITTPSSGTASATTDWQN
ncbi:alpha-amylase family glycosyl hydrolase [Anaerosporobacter faecicola]|uniref:alpha-amylase family glycosyl hydrolase n=1 Tax=Anaerosporobacter faecicola TaxID=2718714 RepID=UPI001A9AEFA3|nr:alpha-amylase family glycosyl hydrolase [Anaerosporobacter faecicola]